MAETIDNVAERLAKLEVTVAQGFHDTTRRFQALEDTVARGFHDANSRFQALEGTVAQGIRASENRDAALSRKIDVVAEDMRADIGGLTDAVNALTRRLNRDD